MKRSDAKMYIVRKYVKATSVSDALRKEKKIAPHDVFVDDEWKKTSLADAIGFGVDTKEEEEE